VEKLWKKFIFKLLKNRLKTLYKAQGEGVISILIKRYMKGKKSSKWAIFNAKKQRLTNYTKTRNSLFRVVAIAIARNSVSFFALQKKGRRYSNSKELSLQRVTAKTKTKTKTRNSLFRVGAITMTRNSFKEE
jgi:hypothetical protein